MQPKQPAKLPNINTVRRRLFQDEDNNENEEPSELNIQDGNAQTARWNFDFANETPLEGDWEWERVAESD